MSSVDKALETQLKNIQTKTGRTLEELREMIRKSGLAKHGPIRSMLKRDLGLGHGDANTLTHYVLQSAGPAAEGDPLDAIYSGPKAALRPIHDRFMKAIEGLGDFDIAPKKTYVNLRRKKQFAMVGPATNTRVEVGLNMKGVAGTARLEALPPGGMCQYRVKVTDPDEIDPELIGWVRKAYDSAG